MWFSVTDMRPADTWRGAECEELTATSQRGGAGSKFRYRGKSGAGDGARTNDIQLARLTLMGRAGGAAGSDPKRLLGRMAT